MELPGNPLISKAEERQHQSAIQHLVSDLRLSEPGVLYLYDFILRRYLQRARIKDFLPILVSRRVKDLLHEHQDGDRRATDFEGRRGRSPYP